MGFPRQEYWNGLPFLSPGDLPDPGIEPGSHTLQGDSLLSEPLEAGVKIQFGIVINQPVVSTFAEADGASSVFTDNF